MKARPDLEALIAAERAERPSDAHRQASFEQVCRALAAGHAPISLPVEPLGVLGSAVGAKGAAAGAQVAASAAVGGQGAASAAVGGQGAASAAVGGQGAASAAVGAKVAAVGAKAAAGAVIGAKSAGVVVVGVKALATTAVLFGVGSAGYLWTEEYGRVSDETAIHRAPAENGLRGAVVHPPAVSSERGAARSAASPGSEAAVSAASPGSEAAVSAASPGSEAAVARPPLRSEPVLPVSRLPERGRESGAGGVVPPSAPVASGPGPTPVPAATPGGGFDEELRLLERAKRESSAGRPQLARAALSEHRERFRRGILAPEREALSAMLDCASGHGSPRDAERGRERFAAFVRDFPSSPLAARVRRTCLGDGE